MKLDAACSGTDPIFGSKRMSAEGKAMTCGRHDSTCNDAEKEVAAAERPRPTHRPPKKHPCPDCHFCQMCSDSRCNACRSEKGCSKKLSFSEQIRLYEEMNAKDPLIRKRSK